MRYAGISVLVIISAILFSACSPKSSDILVGEFGNYNITLNDFEKAYARNVGGVENAKKDSIKDYHKFLDLYLNFRMKLRDAQVRQYQNDPALQSELANYKTQVGVSYIKEKGLIEPALKDLYEKRKYELRISHILIKPDSLGDEAAKAKAQEVIDKYEAGESFDKLAKEYSSDRFSKDMGGDIYFITAGQTIPEFEDAAYKTKVGDIYPEPVETRYGYHVIKVTAKQKRRASIRASHILINFFDENNKPDTAGALKQITEIKSKLDAGEDFAELAKKYSEDKGTAEKGGDLGFFERRMMVKEFDNVAFKLKIGEISNIVKTRFGYHIIKLTDEKQYPTFNQEKIKLKSLYEKAYYKNDFDKLIAKLKEEYHFRLNGKFLKNISAEYDTLKLNNSYTQSPLYAEKDSAAFFIDNKPISLDSLMASILRNAKVRNRKLNYASLTSAIDEYASDLLLQKKASDLDKSDQEFASLMEDYKNGIYIFKLQEEEVWDKINVDTTKLYDYYLSTKNDYMWPDRIDYSEIFTKKDPLIKKYYKMLKEGADFDSIATAHTERFALGAKAGNYGLVPVDKSNLSKLANQIQNVGDFSEPQKVPKGWSIFKLNKREPARVKTFKEAKAEVASIYQENESKRLEDEYIQKLKTVYKPKLFYENLDLAFIPRPE